MADTGATPTTTEGRNPAAKMRALLQRAALEAVGIFLICWPASAISLWLGWNKLRPLTELLRDGPAWLQALCAAGFYIALRVVLGAPAAFKADDLPQARPTGTGGARVTATHRQRKRYGRH
jgi:hypothetical protein